MEFRDWPWGLMFFTVYLGLFLWGLRRPQGPALKLADPSALRSAKPSRKVRAAQTLPWLRLVAVALVALSLARPQVMEQAVKTQTEGVAILMVLDRSSSMLDPMLYEGQEMPRLQVVKQVFGDFILGTPKGLPGRGADLIGLMTFSGFVDEISPLTRDHQSLVHFAQGLQVAQRYEDGTMIGDAIAQSTLRMIAYQGMLGHEGKGERELKSKILILLTDGQQTPGGTDPLEAAKTAAANGIKLYSIAIVGEPPQFGGLGSFFRLNNPFLDTSMIEEAARITGGAFFKATTGESLRKVYQEIDRLEKSQFEERQVTYKERFAWFLVPALGLLLLEFILSFGPLRKLP
ncbi:MAG: hypothetical protein A2600_13945 [Candidatus Lambdaproteobacteria bacterium RIFOXYD1_FULL_56_27]|uniref:VWFA domain-containing protein n=1 Tax=Candidatus Lambdaproteobacteria bacterium RIFOXYD2_FULL_56_26 TaxID=1817773 RepID=A0A1F6GNS2_9PROT|nr:MAG: hypothetical protein A2557_06170 [Candidatus Lambdaproteobacteria bacterium RIFOXYD2_FULL_56_26]OGG99891.1 MAG: hypothetical protein A2426_09905 [Candidatus Lambdaproteobacteria bacterium RIFOXYC1_FULL_56_13]OGH06290.1 MAG: hypothetical protein A2600_13945 [Candidatus Lambdaproteobacteria bacterium RIFOXYD1_FULL_56_27]